MPALQQGHSLLGREMALPEDGGFVQGVRGLDAGGLLGGEAQGGQGPQ